MSTNTHDTAENNVKAPLLGVQSRQYDNYQATEGQSDSSAAASGEGAQPGQETPKPAEETKSIWIIVIGLCTGIFLSALDSSIVAIIYAKIGSDFHASNEVSWVITSYLLSYTALQPLYGRLSDIFGRQSVLLFATFMFFIGSAACGAASNIWWLVAARAIAGIGGGGLNTMAAIIMSDLVSLRERGKFQTATIIGAPVGGWISDSSSWRYCFYINLPILLACFIITYTQITNYNIKPDSGENSFISKLTRIDYFGSGSLILGVVGLLLGSAWGGNTLPWSSPIVISCLVGGSLLLIVFVFIEANIAKEPIMPWRVLKSQTPFAVSMANFFGSMNSTPIIFFAPLYFQAIQGTTASKAGVNLIPKVIGASVGSLSSGLYMSRSGNYQSLTRFAFFLTILGSAGLKLWGLEYDRFWLYAVPLVLDGFGFGTGLTTTLIALLASVEQKDIAVAASMSYLFRATGSVLGVSICSAIFQALLKSELIANIHGPDANEIIDTVRKSVSSIRNIPKEYQNIVIAAYLQAIQGAFSITIVFAVLAFISSLFIQKLKLNTTIRR
ncbi:hypothetical protein BC937DRAFT_90787 [Endogone sp. FLAS-F59071]|nr:hypothetical protein BC937DRAFT_90787 [Endogone sp. FLAS-F59071]|eukprot:RUS23203.1 hypothetical protein BC937DRAFT_90787 [Endogone sp. FLAS-F59071]